MTISDIITLLTLVIALFAIIKEGYRSYLIFKINNTDWAILASLFIAIHYFAFFKSFKASKFYFQDLFYSCNLLPEPITYSYILSLAGLVFIFYKINFSFFPSGKIDHVINFYSKQIENGYTSFLFDLIEWYHSKDISEYLKSKPKDKSQRKAQRALTHPASKRYSLKSFFINGEIPKSKNNRFNYAKQVLFKILSSPALIQAGSKNRPFLYADLFPYFSKERKAYFPKNLVSSFFYNLMSSKNFWFIQELQNCENHRESKPTDFYESNRIIGSVLKDLSVADINELWFPFRRNVIEELEVEREKGFLSKLFHEYTLSEKYLWSFKTYHSIVFMYHLTIESIFKDYPSEGFFTYFYSWISREIIKTFEKYPPNGQVETYYHKFTEEMLDNYLSMLDIANQCDSKTRYVVIINGLGEMIYYITRKPNCFEENFLIQELKHLLKLYLTLIFNENVDGFRSSLEEFFKRPSNNIEDYNDHYYTLLNEAWKSLDKEHFKDTPNHDEREQFTRLKNNVIRPLGYAPNTP